MPIDVVCLRQIDNREHREDESLKRNYKHMKHSPNPLQPPPSKARARLALNIVAINIKIISPAYIFPNKRNPKETGLAINVTDSSIMLIGTKTEQCTWILEMGEGIARRKPPNPCT